MGKAKFNDDFKRDAVQQIVVRGCSVTGRSLHRNWPTTTGNWPTLASTTVSRHAHDARKATFGDLGQIGAVFSA